MFHSPEFAPWLTVNTRQGKADVAAVRGQLLTVHFLAHERDEAPWITIAHSVVYQPVRKEVQGFRIHPFGLNLFYGVDLK